MAGAGRLPIWSCSVRGLACHRPYGRRGALLPHLFTLTRLRRGRRRAVCFLCHFPSGHPDRTLSGALPCGVRTFLLASRNALRRGGRLACCEPFILALRAGAGRKGGRAPALPASFLLSVGFLRDLILLELLVEIAARGIDRLGGLRNIPAVLAQLGDQVRTFGAVLEFAQ